MLGLVAVRGVPHRLPGTRTPEGTELPRRGDRNRAVRRGGLPGPGFRGWRHASDADSTTCAAAQPCPSIQLRRRTALYVSYRYSGTPDTGHCRYSGTADTWARACPNSAVRQLAPPELTPPELTPPELAVPEYAVPYSHPRSRERP
jgi:hypothetical protein